MKMFYYIKKQTYKMSVIYFKNYLFILIKIAIDKKINKTPIAIITKAKAFAIPKSVLSTPEVVVELLEVVVDFAFVEV